MTLQQLRDFVAVVAHGGFRAASRSMGRSQAVLTTNVANLEEEYGVRLLERTAGGPVLTGDGEEFLSYARSFLAEADRAQAWLLAPERRSVATVVLGTSVEPCLRLVPRVLADFRRTLPHVTIRLHHGISTELIAAVRESRLELAIASLPNGFAAAEVDVEALYEVTPAVVARTAHPLREHASVEELGKCDWVVLGDPHAPAASDAGIRDLFDDHGYARPRIATVTNSLFGAVSTLLDSDCVACLPRTLLDHPLVSGNLVSLPVSAATFTPFQVSLLRKPSRHLTREAQTLAAMLVSFARITRSATPRRSTG